VLKDVVLKEVLSKEMLLGHGSLAQPNSPSLAPAGQSAVPQQTMGANIKGPYTNLNSKTSDSSTIGLGALRESPEQFVSRWGLVSAFTILGLWAVSLVSLMRLDFAVLPLPARILGVLVQMFLYTGLFITAHDAMHGVVFPRNRRLNDAIGALAVRLYALFDYKKLLQKHGQHHNYPASHFDPDFHNGQQRNFFAWYGNFMVNYWSWWRLFGLMATYNLIHIFLHIPEDNLRYFWILPSVLSSVQLFFFGTYLPHRQPKGGYTSPHRANSTALPVIWSFLTCYHFGYHEEHHAQPHLPWWALPVARGLRIK
jgi:beta-carotene/zeaxanthin 4-ketolase